MPLLFGLPVHPAAAHFPIAASAFGAAALVVAAWLTSRGKAAESYPWRIGGLLLLVVALLGAPVMIWSGRAWAISMDDMATGSLLPRPDAEEGVLYKHALSAGATAVAILVATVFAFACRNPRKAVLPATAAALLAAALFSLTGHLGGTMVHKPAGPPAEVGSTK
jgi:uncharacterized membrane protein